MALGLLVCLGWLSDVERLKSPFPGVSMKFNAALGFVLTGVALWRMPHHYRAAGCVFALVAVGGGLSFAQDLFGWELGIDQLFVGEAAGREGSASPGRMSPTASLCFLLLGVGGLLSARGSGSKVSVGQGLVFFAGAGALLSVVGYAYGFKELYQVQGYTAIGLHTAIGLVGAAFAVVLSRPDFGIGWLLGLHSTAGVMFRSALPTVVLIPFLIGWISMTGERADWWSQGFATSATVVMSAAVMLTVLMAVTFRAHETEAILILRDGALESTEVAVVIVDARSDDLPIVEVNASFEQLTGYRPSEVLGRNCRFLNANARDQEGLDVVRQALRDQQSCDVILLNHKKDGSEFWNRLVISPVRSAFGEVTHFVGISRDVSGEVARERERDELLDAAREAREAAERALGARDEFLGVVSHELRSPLHSARLWASILMDNGAQVDPAEIGGHLVRSIDAQSRLVSDLLDVSRFAVDRGLDLDLTVQDLRPLISSTIDDLAPNAAEGSLTLRVELPEVPILVDVDPDRIVQLVRNLVDNSIRFTPRGGQVCVALLAEDKRAVLTTTDTGCGLTEEDRRKVFERFWQSTSGGARKRGLGLGLTIVKHLVEGHGGAIAVHSDGPGRGTTFVVELPLAKRVAAHKVKQPRPQQAGRIQRALVVDDDPSARSALANVLSTHGFEVRSAASAGEAIELVDRQSITLLISDIMLTERSGVDLIRELRARASFGDVPIAIAISGHGLTKVRRDALAAGFDAFLAKPVASQALLALISAMMAAPEFATEDGPA